MRKNHILVIIALLFVFIYMFIGNIVFAEEVIDEQKNESEQTELENNQKDEVLQNIQDYISVMRQEISKIDKKLNSLKNKKEYVNYPAIRLNIDTPMFGLVSIVNQKLKITNEVSAIDIAKGYSIRDIIKSNSLKVPSFSVASIVVITRDIKLNKDISLSDANSAILKLTQYVNQIQSVNDFLDVQISKIYAGYIKKEKADVINKLKARTSDLSNKIKSLDEKIVYAHIIYSKNELLDNYINSFLQFEKDIYNINNSLKNVLIEDDELDKIEAKVKELEESIGKFEVEIDEYLPTITDETDMETILINYREEIVQIRDKIEEYISKSVEKVENNQEKEENTEEDKNESLDSNIVVEKSVILYDVVSENILDNINSNIEYIENKIKEILGEATLNMLKGIPDGTPEEVINKGEVTGVSERELTVEEKEKLINEFVKRYKEVISNEYTFYIDNMKLLLNDAKDKVSALSKQTEANVLTSLKYVYLEVPTFIEKNLNLYDENNVIIDTKTLAESIKTELNHLCDVSKSINKIYEEKKRVNEITGS